MNKKALAEYIAVFNKLGYHTKKKGALYFFSLLDEVRSELENGLSDEEIRKKLPAIALEEYHFYFEVKKSVYCERINDFLNDKSDLEEELPKAFIDPEENLSIEDTVLLFAKYFDAKKKATEEKNESKNK